MELIYKIPRNEKLLKNLMWCNIPACSRSSLIQENGMGAGRDAQVENETSFIVLQYIL